jgi:predicted PurR-regulated permease PerM
MRSWMRKPPREAGDATAVEFEPRDFAGLFAAPRWLRDLGRSSWLLVGITLAVVGSVWVATLTKTIVTPVIAAAVVAAVASPLVKVLERRGMGRGVAAALLLLAFLVLAVVVIVVVLGGITSQFDEIRAQLRGGRDTLAGWLNDLGVSRDAADSAKDDVSNSLSSALPALLEGVGNGLKRLSSLVVFLGLTFLATFFLLKDGPSIRHWAEGHMRVPRRVAHGMSDRVLEALRGYFVGVTAVAVFNALVVGIGALLLGVPLAGSIAAVTFIGAYIPYLGAWSAGIFSVVLALGGAGPDAAVGMIVVQVLANGLLQQLVQPIAYGAALGIHPLAVLLVTIAGGSLFGAVGLILAAPVTSAATRISADLARAREAAAAPPPPPASNSAPAAVT